MCFPVPGLDVNVERESNNKRRITHFNWHSLPQYRAIEHPEHLFISSPSRSLPPPCFPFGHWTFQQPIMLSGFLVSTCSSLALAISLFVPSTFGGIGVVGAPTFLATVGVAKPTPLPSEIHSSYLCLSPSLGAPYGDFKFFVSRSKVVAQSPALLELGMRADRTALTYTSDVRCLQALTSHVV